MEEFFELMRQDDVLDADLTELGKEQAKKCHQMHFSRREEQNQHQNQDHCHHLVDLIVSSPLSRALETAELVYPTTTSTTKSFISKVCLEDFREVNGALLNGKRRTKAGRKLRHRGCFNLCDFSEVLLRMMFFTHTIIFIRFYSLQSLLQSS
jgi:broad specificity phosphatase PhoE